MKRPLSILFLCAVFLSGFQSLLAAQDLYGYIDKSGKVVIPALYDYADDFSEGLACVEKNGKWGFIDKTGKVVVELKFDQAKAFSEDMAAVMKNRQYGYIDKTGKIIIEPQYEAAGPFKDGLAAVSKKGRYGYIDKTGKAVIPLQYEYADDFSQGLACVEKNGKHGFVDKTGKVVIPLNFDAADFFFEGLARADRNNAHGYIDKTGEFVILWEYGYFSQFQEGLAAFQKNQKWGFFDNTGKIVVEPQYEDAAFFCDGLAAVKKNDKWGFIDKTGQMVIEPQYDDFTEKFIVPVIFTQDLARVMKNGKFGFIDKTGKFVIEPQFAEAGFFCEGLAYVIVRQGSVPGKKRPLIEEDTIFSLSRPGRLLAVLDADYQTVRLCAVEFSALTADCGLVLKFDAPIYNLALSPDEKYIAVRDWQNNISVSEIDPGQGKLKQIRSWKEPVKDTEILKYSPDGKIIAGCNASTLWLADTGGKLVIKFQPHAGRINDFCFAENGELLATAGDDGAAKLWTMQGKPIKSFNLEKNQGTYLPVSVVFSPDASLLLAGAQCGQVYLIDIKENRSRKIDLDYVKDIKKICFSPQGDLFAYWADYNYSVRVYSLNGTMIEEIPGLPWILTTGNWEQVLAASRGSKNKTAFLQSIITMSSASFDETVFSPAGDYFVARDNNSNALLLCGLDGKPERIIKADDYIRTFAVSADGEYLALASDDLNITVWTRQGKMIGTLGGHKDKIKGVSFSEDTAILYAWGCNELISWRRDGSIIDRKDISGEHCLLGVSLGNEKYLISAADHKKEIRLASGKLVSRLGDYSQSGADEYCDTEDVSFSPADGSLLLVRRGKVELYSDRGKLLLSIKTNILAEWENMAVFSPSGRYLAVKTFKGALIGETVSAFYAINIYNTGGKLLWEIKETEEKIADFCFSQDEKYLLSAGGSVRIWRLEDDYSKKPAPKVINLDAAVIPVSDRDKDPAVIMEKNADSIGTAAVSVRTVLVKIGKKVYLFDLVSGKQIREFDLDGDEINISADGKYILIEVYADDDDYDSPNYQLQLFRAADGKLLWKKRYDNSGWSPLRISGGYVVFVTRFESYIIILDLLTGKEIKRLGGVIDQTCNFKVTADAGYLVSWGGSDHVTVYELFTGKLLRMLEGYNDKIISGERPEVVVAKDNNYAACYDGDHVIKVWNFSSGKLLWTVPGLKDCKGLLLSSDNKYLFAWKDNAITMWDFGAKTQVKSFRRRKDKGEGQVFLTADDRYLVSVQYGVIQVFDLRK